MTPYFFYAWSFYHHWACHLGDTVGVVLSSNLFLKLHWSYLKLEIWQWWDDWSHRLQLEDLQPLKNSRICTKFLEYTSWFFGGLWSVTGINPLLFGYGVYVESPLIVKGAREQKYREFECTISNALLPIGIHKHSDFSTKEKKKEVEVRRRTNGSARIGDESNWVRRRLTVGCNYFQELRPSHWY